MINLLNQIQHVYRDEEGATMVEYALVVFLIAAVAAAAVGRIGQAVELKLASGAYAFPK